MRLAGLAWLLVLIAPIARAGCEDLLERLNRDFGYPTDSPTHIACKPWPLEPSKAIIVLARKVVGNGSSQSSTDSGEGVYDLEVMVQATDSGEILFRETERGALISDALTLQEVAVDGTQFPLAKGVSAFGVRVRRSNRHSEIESLSLYALRDGRVVRILAPLQTTRSFCESPDGTQCSRTEKTRGTLALADSSTRGWTDLVFTERNTVREFESDGTPIASKEVRSARKFRLRYDGRAYVIPKLLLSEQH